MINWLGKMIIWSRSNAKGSPAHQQDPSLSRRFTNADLEPQPKLSPNIWQKQRHAAC